VHRARIVAARLGGTEEDTPIDLNALVSPYLGLAVVVLAVVLVFTLIGLVVQNRRVTTLEVRLLRLTRGSEDGNLEDVLDSHLDTVARVLDDVDELAARSAMLEARGQRAFSRIGLVRFNPFEDTGGNQSFALALLDGREDGIVLSSLHTRAVTRIYAKAVSGGRSDGALSDEESQAVELARSSSGGRSMDGSLDVRIAGPTGGAAMAGAATAGAGSYASMGPPAGAGSTAGARSAAGAAPAGAAPAGAAPAGAAPAGAGLRASVGMPPATGSSAGTGSTAGAARSADGGSAGTPPPFATSSSAYPASSSGPRALPDGGVGGR